MNKSCILIAFLLFATVVLGNDATKILMFGDSGTNDQNQKTVAKDMADFCHKNGCDMAITVGDNIYPAGIPNIKEGKTDFRRGQPAFQLAKNKFVDHYEQLNIPHFMSLGNHDVDQAGISPLIAGPGAPIVVEEGTPYLINNQINFTTNELNPLLDSSLASGLHLWNLWKEYFHVAMTGKKLHLFSINTNFFPHQALDENGQDIHNYPRNYLQYTWLSAELGQTNQGDWKIVYGHVPLFSHGHHGYFEAAHFQRLRSSILPMLCQNKVDFYIGGHDHHLEVDQYRCPNGHLIVAIITGAAAKTRSLDERTIIKPIDRNFLWGNGFPYLGGSVLRSNQVLGFSHLVLPSSISHVEDSPMKATLRMHITEGEGADGCFEIVRGSSINSVDCASL